MALPQIDAATCAVIVTVSLWMWTRLKLPTGCYAQETALRRQNMYAYWSFGTLIGLELLADSLPFEHLQLAVGPLSALVFHCFGVASYQTENGFWSKRRNQWLCFILATGISFGAGVILVVSAF